MMKHAYGLTIGIYARQRDYTRGQTLQQWLLSAQCGSVRPWNHDELNRLGGHEKVEHWARITVIGVTVQIGVEHAISNWERKE